MTISIQCRECGHKLLVPKNQLGKTGRCPVCAALLRLPDPVDLGPRLKATPPVDFAHGKPESKPLPTFGITCPACGVRMRLLEKYRGSIVRCPDCNEPFTAEKSLPAPDPKYQ